MPAANRNTIQNRLLTKANPARGGAPIEDVYFVEEGLGSVLTSMANGTTIEVGMIGMEGVIGMSALLGATVSAQIALVQIPGTAHRMSASRCKHQT